LEGPTLGLWLASLAALAHTCYSFSRMVA
jgi:hypothetical protein